MKGFKSFISASATLDGVKVAHDPQTTIKPLWPIRISTIRGICWIAMSKLRVFPSRAAVCDKT
jgi:hypothetical protein